MKTNKLTANKNTFTTEINSRLLEKFSQEQLTKGYKKEDIIKAIVALTGFSTTTAIVIYKILTASKVAFLFL